MAMTEIVTIARCPEHGLHGERTECFVCEGAVEQVEMVRWVDVREAVEGWERLMGKIRAEMARPYVPSAHPRHPSGAE